ncbi:MAG TPA: hypothetical protein VNQ76_02270, partial [Planctomicrobium sp.]|nr:hypothetical protein [Planctomicrobium sp.]
FLIPVPFTPISMKWFRPRLNNLPHLVALLDALEAAGTASTLMADHVGEENPHAQYAFSSSLEALELIVSGKLDAGSTTASISDSLNRRYVTDAQLSVLGLTSGVNTGDQDLSGYSVVGHGHTISDITDLTSTLAAKADLINGFVPSSQMPARVMTNVYTVTSEEDMLELEAQEGDVAIRTDISTSFMHNGGTSGTAADWSELISPTDAVTSVNGLIGNIVLGYSDVGAAAASHNHSIADVTGLASALSALETLIDELGIADIAGLTDALAGKAAAVHSHVISDTTGLQGALDGKAGLSAANTFTANQVVNSNLFSVTGPSDPRVRVAEGSNSNSYIDIIDVAETSAAIIKRAHLGPASLTVDPVSADGESLAQVTFLRTTNTTGGARLVVHRGNNTSSANCIIGGSTDTYFNALVGNLAVGHTSPQAKFHSTGSTILGASDSAVADANLGNGQVNIWIDNQNTLIFKVKTSGGTVKTASLPLT